MQLSDSLEVAIGLSFMFFLTSLVLASVHEAIEAVMKARGKYLFAGIQELLRGKTAEDVEATAKTIYSHPLIQGLMRGGVDDPNFRRNLPSYVPTRNFALALLDQAAKGAFHAADAKPNPPSALPPVQQLRITVEGIENTQLRDALIHAIDNAGGAMDAAQANIEQWFDSAMDRVSGWYKRRSQWIIFGLGLATALALNVNTVVIGQSLAGSMSMRHALVDQAGEAIKTCKPGENNCPTDTIANNFDKANLPIGWGDQTMGAMKMQLGWPGKSGSQEFLILLELVAGYLLTAFAVTLGAPFWFDILGKLMVIRATVKPDDKPAPAAPPSPPPPAKAAAAQPAPGAPPPIDGDIYNTPPDPSDLLFEDDYGNAVGALILASEGGA